MADRIDALTEDDSERRAAFTGGLLSRELDVELQACVEAAAADIGAPIALVSLVLARTQFFRAHCGLPADLAIARSTDRSASFCQFVVRDGAMFEVNDAEGDPRVPQDLVTTYGIRAYLGVPVVANNAVVGSLCVIDTQARAFSDKERDMLHALSRRASERMQALAKVTARPLHELVQQAVAPAFGEIRNLLVPLTIGVSQARVCIAELEPLAALVSSNLSPTELRRAISVLGDSAAAVKNLARLHEDMESAAGRLYRAVAAVENVTSAPDTWAPVLSVVTVGLELARHVTKLVGGVTVGPIGTMLRLNCPMATAAALVSAAASGIANAAIEIGDEGPMSLSVVHDDDRVLISLRATELDQPAYVELEDRLRPFVADLPGILVVATGGLSLSFINER